MRTCRYCGETQPLDQFAPAPRNKDGRGYKCRACRRQWKQEHADLVRAQARSHYQRNREAIITKTKAWHAANPERSRQLAREGMRRVRSRSRGLVLEAYGAACACCGETEPRFLALDHIAEDGAAHRAAMGSTSNIYRDVIRREFPPGFQLLCHNCNMAKSHGGCPHRA